MDWKAVNFDWNRARAFLVTAEEGSLSAAARALGMTQPTLGRQVSALEKELNVVLFERAGQGLILTPNGLDLVEHVRAMGEAANKVSLAASGQSQSIEGCVCISASEVHAYFWLPKIIKKLRCIAPKINIEIIATNKVSDLRRREADIAIRNFRPTHPELIARKIKDEQAQLYATADYIQQLNKPISLSSLNQADFISFDSSGLLTNGLNEMGLSLTKANFPIISENFLTHWQLIKQGLGIGIMPIDIAESDPLVLQVMPDFPAIEYPVWLTTHRELNSSRRVRLVFDLLVEELQKPYQAD